MMLGSVLTALYVICTLYAAANGTAEATGRALMEGAQAAVPFVIGIAGGICLWSGVLELLERCGAAGALARALKRPLRRLFPRSTERREILEALTENLSANLLGLGNAATPAGIRAVRRIRALGAPAADELCLWSGVLELLERCGAAGALAGLLRRPLRRLFPRSAEKGEILSALTENLSANLLGLGNAATPAGIRAARGMAALGERGKDELCLLVVLNTASLQLLPATVATMRAAAGAKVPFDILPAVWLSSACSVGCGLGAAALFRRLWR